MGRSHVNYVIIDITDGENFLINLFTFIKNPPARPTRTMWIMNFFPINIDYFNQNKCSKATILRVQHEDSLEFVKGHIFILFITFMALLAFMHFLRLVTVKKGEGLYNFTSTHICLTGILSVPTSIYVFYRRRIDIEPEYVEWNQRIHLILATAITFLTLTVFFNSILCSLNLLNKVYFSENPSENSSENPTDPRFLLPFLADLCSVVIFAILLQFCSMFCIYNFVWSVYATYLSLVIICNILDTLKWFT